MLKVFNVISKLAQVNTPVLIRGESGTGKELVAKAIHYNGPRKDRAFLLQSIWRQFLTISLNLNCLDTKREHLQGRLKERLENFNMPMAAPYFSMRLEILVQRCR